MNPEPFRKLREAWFTCHIKRHAFNPHLESPEARKEREKLNAAEKRTFDENTERIINGEELPVT